MKCLSIFSRKKVKDEQDKHGDVLQNEKDASSLETMSAEMTSLKSRLLSKEAEVQILKDTVAQKDEEINRLKNILHERAEEIKRMTRKQDEKRFQPIFRPIPPSASLGPPLQSYLSIAESDLVGARRSRPVPVPVVSAPERSVD